MTWLHQFLEIGVPRCQACDHLIWPWQSWICGIEEWPKHHVCFHGHLVEMLAYVRSERDFGEDFYDACRFCHRTTDSGFVLSQPVTTGDQP